MAYKRRGCLTQLFSWLTGRSPRLDAGPWPPQPRRQPAPPHMPYLRHESLLTRAEASFYRALAIAVEDLLICVKVRLGDIVRPGGVSMSRKQFLFAVSQVSQKHVDFVLCDPQSFRPLLGIELDDPSHDRPDRVARDAFVDGVFATVGLPLLHIRTQPGYDSQQLRQQIHGLIGQPLPPAGGPAAAPAQAPRPASPPPHQPGLPPQTPLAQPATPPAAPAQPLFQGAQPRPLPPATQPAEPKPIYLGPGLRGDAAAAPQPAPAPQCPSCQIPMVLRVVRQGQHAGKQFYGCANYPGCRQMRPFDKG